MKSFITIAALALGVMGTTAVAQESTNRVAAETDWSVFQADNPKECWAVTAPKQTVNTRNGQQVSVNRSEILLMVFDRPGANVKGQLAFTGGYPFAKGRFVEMKIGGTTFNLSTDGGEWAWPATSGDDAKIVAAMKRGASAIITAQSSRGTQTQDTFSLLGFTAAVDQASKNCAG